MSYNPTDWKNRIVDSDGTVVQEGTPLTAENMNKLEEQVAELANERGKPEGTATLNENGIIHSSQLPSNLKEIRVVADISERDSLDKFEGLRVLVTDASADSTVGNGWAEYVWNGTSFIKTAEMESLDVVLSWTNIQDKPNKFTPTEHPHTESDITDLDKYSRQEIDDKLAVKANKNDVYIPPNREVLEQIQQSDLEMLDNHETKIAGLEETVSEHTLHLNELQNHTHDYEKLINKPSIPSKTSDLANDSQFVQSNAGRIHVSYSDNDIPPLQPNDIVIKVL
jgi:hypothetical protein